MILHIYIILRPRCNHTIYVDINYQIVWVSSIERQPDSILEDIIKIKVGKSNFLLGVDLSQEAFIALSNLCLNNIICWKVEVKPLSLLA